MIESIKFQNSKLQNKWTNVAETIKINYYQNNCCRDDRKYKISKQVENIKINRLTLRKLLKQREIITRVTVVDIIENIKFQSRKFRNKL